MWSMSRAARDLARGLGLVVATLCGCAGPPSPLDASVSRDAAATAEASALDAHVTADRDEGDTSDVSEVTDAPEVSDALTAQDTPIDATLTGEVELGSGQDRFEDLPRSGGRAELVHGPQGGWHIYGRVRLRGIPPDVYLTFALSPAAGGAPVNFANDTVRRQLGRGLVQVGDAYESSYGELVILADGVRPPDVVGRSFRFSVRVERPDATMPRTLVGTDERVLTVVDEVP